MSAAQKTCSSCGGLFTPDPGLERSGGQRRCSSCSLVSLAAFIEEPDPTMTLKEISKAEQLGAWLRDLAHKL